MNNLGLRYQSQSTGTVHTFEKSEKIWTWYYKCLVPDFQSRSAAHIAQNGVYVTGIKSLDKALKNDWVRRYLTIDKMVDFYQQGVTVRVIDVADTKDIYDTVQTHLTLWLDTIRTGLNISDAPISDLIVMDRFAATVYPFAKPLFTPEALESALAKHIDENQRVTLANFFNNPLLMNSDVTLANPIPSSEIKEPEIERESLADHFKSSLASLRRW